MITGFYTAILAVMLVGLIVLIIRRRYKYRVGLGHGNVPELEQAVRAHGNFVEMVPFLLIEMALLEWEGAPEWSLHLFGIMMVIARLCHAQGLYRSSLTSKERTIGVSLSLLLMVGAGLVLALNYILKLA